MAIVALLHALVIRRAFLGGESFANLQGTLPHWMSNFFAFAAGSLVPLHTEYLEGHPFLAGFLVLVGVGFAFLWAHRKDRHGARLAAVAAIAFLILLGPSLLSFQERYLYIPSAALAMLLVILAPTLPRKLGHVVWTSMAVLWVGSLGWHAVAWTDAARVSTHLIEGLRQTSEESEAGGILVANMPHRVHGVAVAANFREAVVLSGGREVPIKAATALDFPGSRLDGLAGGFARAIARSSEDFTLSLEVPARRFSRVVLPVPGKPVVRDPDGEWEVTVQGGGKLRVRLPLPARSALRVWTADGLRPLEAP